MQYIKNKSPVFYINLYIIICLVLWISQSVIGFNVGYGFAVLLISYFYFYFGAFVGNKYTICRAEDTSGYLRCHTHKNVERLLYILLFIDVVIIVYLGLEFKNIIALGVAISDYRNSLFTDQSIKDYYGPFAAYLFVYATLVPLFGMSYGLYLKVLRNKKNILIFSIFLLTIKEAILISRYYIFAPVLASLLLLFCYDAKMTLKKVIFTLIVFLVLLLAMFAFRGDSDLAQSLINARNYMVAGYSLLTHAIDSNAEITKFYNLSSPYSMLGIVGSKMYNQGPFFNKIQDFVYLGNAGYFNAFYTSLFLPFLYLGAVGLSLISFIYGFLISKNHLEFIRKLSFLNFNTLFALLTVFFSHQFLPVQLSFFWDYFLISILVHIVIFCIINIRRHF